MGSSQQPLLSPSAVPLEHSLLEFTSSMTADQRCLWFRTAFSLPRLPWASVLRQWSGYLTRIPQDVSLDQVPTGTPLLIRYPLEPLSDQDTIRECLDQVPTGTPLIRTPLESVLISELSDFSHLSVLIC